MSKPKVLVCVLTGTERHNWLCPDLAMNLVTMARDPRFEVYFGPVINMRPFEAARNVAVDGARRIGAEWLLSLDNDNFVPGNPLDIIAAAGPNQHVISLSCGIQNAERSVAFSCTSDAAHAVEGPFREIHECVGGGVLMIRDTVWKKIPRGPWFRWRHDDNELLTPGPGTRGEDGYFAELVRQRGFKVWTHQQKAGHYHTLDLTGIAGALLQHQGGQPVPMKREGFAAGVMSKLGVR
jgi:hypothetical protein